MRGYLVKDWDKFELENPKHQKMLLQSFAFRCALQNKFVDKEFANSEKFVKAHGEIRAAYQAFTTTGDFPPQAIAALEKYHALTNYDMGYESIFDVRDFTGSRQGGFKIGDVQSGMTFRRIPIGGKVLLKQMSGSEEYVPFHFYGGGLNWHRSLFMNQDYWTIEDNAMEFINKAYSQRAQAHYDLLEAVMDTLTCIALTDPGCTNCDAYSVSLAIAINHAITTILTAVQNKGYGVSPTVVFYILTPLRLMGAVRRALSVNVQAFPGSEKWSSYNVVPINSMMLANTNRLGIFLPKLKIKSGYRMNLSIFNSFDMLTFSDASAGWLSYGAAVGDTDQIECIDASAPSGVPGGPTE